MTNKELTLDPECWDEFSREAHAALDEVIRYLSTVRDRPVWQPIPPDTRAFLKALANEEPQGIATAIADFREHVLPYPTGNIHPRFWAWVAGSGSPVGVVADMLASGMNSINHGRDNNATVRVELQVIGWLKSLFGFPEQASGLLVSGGSMANFVGLAAARAAKSPEAMRRSKERGTPPALIVYMSAATHLSVPKALALLAIDPANLRTIPVDEHFEIDLEALKDAIKADRAAGSLPAIIVANAGAVNTGAVDPLDLLADIAKVNGLWLHVDGALGATAYLIDSPPANLRGLSRADSLAFDLHKWLHQPYNAGVVLVRDAAAHREAFHVEAPYFQQFEDGLAAGPADFNSLGIDMSRSSAALRVWMTFKAYGVRRFRDLVQQNLDQARYLTAAIEREPALELLAPTALNIVNFRYNPGADAESDLDDINSRILTRLQTEGIAAPSSTQINGMFSIRVCITNHRTRRTDLDVLVKETVRIGAEVIAEARVEA